MINDPYHYKSKFVISVLIIFAALLAYGYLTGSNALGMDDSVVNQKFTDAIAGSDITKCSGLDEVRQNNCIYLVVSRRAVDQNDPALCDAYPAIVQQCKDYYETNKAVTGGGSCENVQDKDQCYLRLAISQSDKTVCENIQETVIRNNCIGIIK